MTNLNGHVPTLRASHPGNVSALKSGAFSRSGRVLAPRAMEIADAIMATGMVADLDRLGAEELGSMLALAETLDVEIERRGAVGPKGAPRAVLDLRMRLTTKIAAWLREYGATPASRADVAHALAQGGLAAEIARRRAQNRSEA